MVLQHISAVPAEVDIAFWTVLVAAADGFSACIARAAEVHIGPLSFWSMMLFGSFCLYMCVGMYGVQKEET
jgi:hypothetical protein